MLKFLRFVADNMSAAELFAFVILPVLLAGIGGIAVIVQHRASTAGWRALQPRLQAEAAERRERDATAERGATVPQPRRNVMSEEAAGL